MPKMPDKMSDKNTNITKKDLVDMIMDQTGHKRPFVREIIQEFLDAIVSELTSGKRIELRDFGVFEVKYRAPRKAQNPKTLEPVNVPAKNSVKFKPGRLMKDQVDMMRPLDFCDTESITTKLSSKSGVSSKRDTSDSKSHPIVEFPERKRSIPANE